MKKSEINYLNCIENVINVIDDDEIEAMGGNTFAYLTKKAFPDLKPIMKALKINKEQALLFCAVFNLNISNSRANHHGIRSALKISSMNYFKNSKELVSLIDSGILVTHDKYDGLSDFAIAEIHFEELMQNILTLKHRKKTNNIYALADDLLVIFERRDNRVSTSQVMFKEEERLIEMNKNVSVVKYMKSLALIPEEAHVFLALFVKNTLGCNEVCISSMADGIYEKIQARINMKRRFAFQESALYKLDIIESIDKDFVEGKHIKFKDEVITKIFGNDPQIEISNSSIPRLCKLIKSESICAKTLFYNQSVLDSINEVHNMLKEDNLKMINKRLVSEGYKAGLTVLLYGLPGTGKTETIYQVGKRTGRDIIMIDISSIKDKYVGESEKRLKNIFNDYKKTVKAGGKTPILLFNESDAIFGKRITVDSSVDQMNNSMQNILLQELEDFEGIFFATTNLVNNMDSAFERRFLYKLQLDKPCIETKMKIWEQKVDNLNSQELELISNSFDFSGGQIDNIVKKAKIDFLLKGKIVGFDTIWNFCNAELLDSKNTVSRIGFVKY